MARNALVRSSPPTLGPTASVRTMVKLPEPSTLVRAFWTASAVAWVSLASVPALKTRARTTNSLGAPKFWISAPWIPSRSSPDRTEATSTGVVLRIWISVPPVNSML